MISTPTGQIQYAELAPASDASLSRALPRLNSDLFLDRWFYLLVALLVVAAVFYANWSVFVPAHGGVDQNGYLFGGKKLAQTWTMKYAPQRPGTVGRA